MTTFDRFITSQWSKLFPLLKNKGAIYLYGNHDQKQFSDIRTSLFSNEQKDNHTLQYNSTIYYIEHGHLLYPSIDIIFPPSRKFMKLHTIEHLLVFLGSPHNFMLRQANNIMKKKLRNKQFPHWYLCGHVHLAEFDEKNKFANSGFIQFGKATYLIVDSSGLSLRTEWY